MTDIKLDIQVVGVAELRQAADNIRRTGEASSQLARQFKPLGAQTQRYVQEVGRLSRELNRLRAAEKAGIIDKQQLAKAEAEVTRQAQKRILTDRTLLAQNKKAVLAEQKRKKELERLTRIYNPIKAAEQEYQRVQKETLKAYNMGVISLDEYKASLAATAKEFGDFTQGVATGGNQFARFNLETYGVRQNIRKFGNIELQQVGYQVGDFFVQVQSGTSAMVAFGQQASQLAGVFGATGALVGAGISIFTALAGSMLRAAEAADSTKESIKAVEAALKSIERQSQAVELGISDTEIDFLDKIALAQLKYEEAQKDFNDAMAVFATQKDNVAELSKDDMLEVLGDEIEAMDAARVAAQEAADEYQRFLSIRTSMSGAAILEAFGGPGDPRYGTEEQERLRKLDEEAAIASLEAQAAAELALLEENAAYEAKIAKMAEEDRLGLLADRGEAERRLAEENAAYEAEQARIVEEDRKGLLEDRGRAEKQLADENAAYEKRVNAERKKQQQVAERFYTKTLNNLTNQNNTLEVQRKYFGQEKQIKQELRILERLKLEDNIKLNKLSDEQADALRLQLNYLHRQEEAVEELIAKEKRLAKLRTPFSGDVSTLTDAQYQRMLDMSQYGPAVAAARGVTFDSDKDKAKGKSPQDKVKNYIKTLKDQFQMEESLIGIFGEQRVLQEALIQARQEYGDIATDSQEEVIRNYIRETHALQQQQKALEDARKKQEELAKELSGYFGDAFLSIVDGTKSVKDAFSDMARHIIRRLYEILVVEQMVQSISGAIQGAMSPVQGPSAPRANANGNIFSRGSVVPFANGGVVGGPTYFPMFGGRTGLMGEAGPEAIMPLKRGKNGKLGVETSGQADNIVINQTFSFAANGDESVKRIIAKEAPKIAQMTQQQIMDSRRRGGQMKAVFG